jgi:hypothetical protein
VSVPETVPAWVWFSLTITSPDTRNGPRSGNVPDPLNWNCSISGEIRSTSTE